ncbi:MAG: monovalent cation/H(+) antiporter subunit G [Sulfuricurvum sp.]|jgi:multicomponent Na+:H+ antiporter subunit G|nr:monovalent cation/H(+) antiporter subunit G [Sulfuricurvum sp.]MDP3023815.1 monovalent cation/H(+) antiporter subunit G [Sulfuricurvum sp.]MDP3120499.1 monovalent cation/H(+) antiporter subunit G [Sulfuricurvum sp.]
MREALEIVANLFLVIGTLFFVVGTVGIFRFFDLYTRLHALSKVDNLGLGFIAFGMMLHSTSLLISLKIFFIWLLALLSSSALSYILSSASLEIGEEPYTRRDDNAAH